MNFSWRTYCADERTNHGDPEVVVSCRPHFASVTDKVGEETGPKVTGEVDRVAGLPTQRGTDSEDEEEEHQRRQVLGAEIVVVLEREDDEDEHGGGDDLGEDLACLGHKGGWISVEDSGSGGVGIAWDGADAWPAFELVDGRFVVSVDDGSAAEAAENLGTGVGEEFLRGEFAEDDHAECYCRVQMASGTSGDVDS